MPSSSGYPGLVVNRGSPPLTLKAGQRPPPLASIDRIIVSEQNVTVILALGSSLVEKDRTMQIPRARAPDLMASKNIHSRDFSIKAQP